MTLGRSNDAGKNSVHTRCNFWHSMPRRFARMASIQRIVSPLTGEVSYRVQVRRKGRPAESARFPIARRLWRGRSRSRLQSARAGTSLTRLRSARASMRLPRTTSRRSSPNSTPRRRPRARASSLAGRRRPLARGDHGGSDLEGARQALGRALHARQAAQGQEGGRADRAEAVQAHRRHGQPQVATLAPHETLGLA